MKREDIERYAREKAKEKYSNSENRMKQYMIAQIHAYCDGFSDAVNLRINSVWHDIEESPKQGSLIAVFDGNDMHLWRAEDIENVIDGRIKVVSITVKECFIRQHIIKWAYIKDLIPTNE